MTPATLEAKSPDIEFQHFSDGRVFLEKTDHSGIIFYVRRKGDLSWRRGFIPMQELSPRPDVIFGHTDVLRKAIEEALA